VTDDPYHLDRFVKAQDSHGTYGAAISELQRGHKVSHWMWFVFPQIAGLGTSPTSMLYAISGLDEARAYLAHPVLGPRLLEAAQVLLAGVTSSAEQIFGSVDAQKLRSCATLFLRAAPEEPLFRAMLDRFFDGVADPMTDRLL
jgi:uncharacterized protein (DUF1810 family)